MHPFGQLGVLGGGGLAAGPLVVPGGLSGPVAFSRAQTGGARATALGADGATWGEFGADVPRFQGAGRRLLLEGQRTNVVRNPRGQGAVAGVVGSGGALPTNWGIFANNGVVTTVVGTGAVAGLPYVDIRFSGTTTATFYVGVFDTTAAAASGGQSVAGSAWVQMVAGSTANITGFNLDTRYNPAGFAPDGLGLPTASLVRRTTVSPAPGGTTDFFPSFGFGFNSGVVIDITLRFAAPQWEIAPWVGTPVLPPAGTPGASTRGSDNLTAPYAALFPSGQGTLLGSFVLPNAASAAGEQVLFDLNDGTINNRITMRNIGGGAVIQHSRVIAGAAANATSVGSMTPGTLFRVGLSWDGAQILGCLNGGAVQSVSGIPSGLTVARLGATVTGAGAMTGECGWWEARGEFTAAGALPGLVTAIP
jgi:hypothetical protein